MQRREMATVLVLLLAGCTSPGVQPISGSPLNASQVHWDAGGVSVIYSFSGAPLSSTPEAGVIADAHGNLYGTAAYGGVPSSRCSAGCGTAFELSPEKGGKWNETVLYSFNNPDTGLYPSNPLVFDAAGNLLGTTPVGGTSAGVAFELVHQADGWQYDVLHDFVGCRDGQQPESGLNEFNGNFYGTTATGGSTCSGGNGTVFELSRQHGRWKYRIIYRFLSYANGTGPQAGLTYDSSGNLYGTTAYGGNSACGSGCGTVFELSHARGGRWTEKVLHQFSKTDGALPDAQLLWDASGNLYGITNQGANSGCPDGCGTIFELSRSKSSWQFSVVYKFTEAQGGGPAGNMVFDESGNLYGTTVIGGSSGDGVVFELSSGATPKYSVLHDFTNSPDGAEPTGLAPGVNGTYFGTTIGGGLSSLGTAFKLTL
jgi:uncharacterized repeat protein (TIGR03803 family)